MSSFRNIKSAVIMSAEYLLMAMLCGLWSVGAIASDWTDNGSFTGLWSSDGLPGWNGTGVPDGQGAVAQLISPPGVFPYTGQDNGAGVTVGQLLYGNNNDMGAFYWQVDAYNSIILDQDGQGVGSPATISNSSLNGTDLNALYFTGNAGFTLNDDLQVLNPAGAFSQNINGSVQFAAPISGTGNITFNSDGPISSTASSSPGAIWVERTNSFTSPDGILVQKGLVIVNNGDGTDVALFTPFGVNTNLITVGENGAGSAGLLSRLSNAPINYAVTIAPNAVGETRTFGAASNGTFTVSTQTVTLNGDLNLRAGSTSLNAIQTYTGNFSGAGDLNKNGSAVALLSGVNTNTGTTTVSEGSLVFENRTSLYNTDTSKWNSTNLVVQAGAGLGFSIGSAGNFTDSDILMLNHVGSATGGFKAGSFLALNPTVASYTYANTISDSPWIPQRRL